MGFTAFDKVPKSRVTMSLTPELTQMLNEYCDLVGQNRSKFVGDLLETALRPYFDILKDDSLDRTSKLIAVSKVIGEMKDYFDSEFEKTRSDLSEKIKG